MGQFIDLTNKRFGELKVVKRVSNDKNNKVQWLCECSCGNEKIIRGEDLRNKKQVTCGKCNIYDVSSSYGICSLIKS